MRLHSNKTSVRNGEASFLAVAETFLASGVFLWVISYTDSLPLFFLACALFPIGLIQTPQSQLLLRHFWARIEDAISRQVGRLLCFARPYIENDYIDVADPPDGIPIEHWQEMNKVVGEVHQEFAVKHRLLLSVLVWCVAPIMFFFLFTVSTLLITAFGAIAYLLQFYCIIRTAIRRPEIAIAAIPDNFSRTCFCADIFLEPSIIPGSYDERFPIANLLTPFRWISPRKRKAPDYLPDLIVGRSYLYLAEKPLGVMLSWFSFFYIFAVAISIRWAVKSSLILYGTVACIWVSPVSTSKIREELQHTSGFLLNKAKFAYSIVLICSFALKLLVCLRLGVVVRGYETLDGQLDWLIAPNSVPLWQFASIANAAMFITLFLYSDHILHLIDKCRIEEKTAAIGFNCYVYLSSCLFAYSAFCLLVIAARQAELLKHMRFGPILPI